MSKEVPPKARCDEEILRRELADELLIYDLKRHRAYCLNSSVARIWNYCDGRRSVGEIAQLLERDLNAQVDERVVWLGLDQLNKSHLLEGSVTRPSTLAHLNRRELVRSLGLVTAVLLPTIASIMAPRAAQAASCPAGLIPNKSCTKTAFVGCCCQNNKLCDGATGNCSGAAC